MANLFDFKDVKIGISRNGFDVGNRFAATAKPGEILPFWWTMVLPGDTYVMKHQHFTRTSPVQTAAFTRMREYFDWYFVPLRLLWKSAGTALTLMQENNVQAVSMSEGIQVTDQMPFLNLKDLIGGRSYTKGSVLTRLATNQFASSENYFKFKRSLLSLKLFNYLGYTNVPDSTAFEFYSADEMESNPDLSADDFKGVRDFVRQDTPVNIFPLLAYQKIYFDYFRHTQWEVNSPFCWNVDFSNGGLLTLPVPSAEENYWYGTTMFDLRYCNWNKDMFMGILPESQLGDPAAVEFSINDPSVPVTGYASGVSSAILDTSIPIRLNVNNKPWLVKGVDGGNSTLTDDLGGDGNAQLDQGGKLRVLDPNGTLETNKGSVSFSGLKIPVSASTRSSVLASSFTILALRQQEFLQRWKEVAQAGSQDFKDQIYRQFGVKVSPVLSNLCTYIGGTATNIDISEVVNQNLDSDTSKADLFGKGVGVGEGSEKFTASEYGVLMCVYHAVPLLDYAISGINKQLLWTSAYDYPIPAFDRIGFEELPTICFTNNSIDYSGGVFPQSLGYVPRYVDIKTSIDRVTGDFINTLQDWVSPVDDSYLTDLYNGSSLIIDYNFFKVNPHLVDRIFGVEANSRVNTDVLRINSYFDVKAVKNFDYNGLPY